MKDIIKYGHLCFLGSGTGKNPYYRFTYYNKTDFQEDSARAQAAGFKIQSTESRDAWGRPTIHLLLEKV